MRVSVDEPCQHQPCRHGLNRHVSHPHRLLRAEVRQVAAVDPLHHHGAPCGQLGQRLGHADVSQEGERRAKCGGVGRLVPKVELLNDARCNLIKDGKQVAAPVAALDGE
eukprot:scaffold5647_cov100-Isochrysis_galbana.AAC.4